MTTNEREEVMTDTTQEELPPLPEPSMLWPEGADKYYPPVFAYDKDDLTAYRDQCIATLKGQCERIKAIRDERERKYYECTSAAQSQAAVMAAALERICRLEGNTHEAMRWDMTKAIANAALAAWKGKQ